MRGDVAGRGLEQLHRTVDFALEQQPVRFADLRHDAVAHLHGPAVDDPPGDDDSGDEQHQQYGPRDEQTPAFMLFFRNIQALVRTFIRAQMHGGISFHKPTSRA